MDKWHGGEDGVWDVISRYHTAFIVHLIYTVYIHIIVAIEYVWVMLLYDMKCSEKTYVVTSEDVGRILRIECVALHSDGSTLAGPVVVYTESVMAAPRLPPRRNLVAVPNAASSLAVQAQFRFRIVSYNILAEIYATKNVRPPLQCGIRHVC
jgi:hypothetical protein